MTKTVLVYILLLCTAFIASGLIHSTRPSRHQVRATTIKGDPIEKYTAVPELSPFQSIRPSINDKARTITHVCTSGTLCTTSVEPGVEGTPFGSYVDYILDNNGWPVLLLSEQSLHTVNVKSNPSLSLFCQLLRSHSSQSAAALSRVTILGTIQAVPTEELSAIKMAFTIAHSYATQIADSPKFSFYKIKPDKIYFSGGFGVLATWVDVQSYEMARPDVIAHEVPTILSKINSEKQGELHLVCKHLLGINEVSSVRLQAIDRLGIDLRVSSGLFTDEYRVAFRHAVKTAEDAKSEVMKLFQEAWERDNGHVVIEDLPVMSKYAEDILRKKN